MKKKNVEIGKTWGDEHARTLEEYIVSMTKEWEDMVRHQNAEDMVKKYTDDSVYIHREGGQVKIIRGIEGKCKSETTKC